MFHQELLFVYDIVVTQKLAKCAFASCLDREANLEEALGDANRQADPEETEEGRPAHQKVEAEVAPVPKPGCQTDRFAQNLANYHRVLV